LFQLEEVSYTGSCALSHWIRCTDTRLDSTFNSSMDYLAESGSFAEKHRGLIHPLMTSVMHYGITLAVTWGTHDALLQQWKIFHTKDSDILMTENDAGMPVKCSNNRNQQVKVAVALIIYASASLAWRLSVPVVKEHRFSTLYEFCWLCNITLVQGALCLLTHRPLLAMSYCVTVGIDQLLWYIDLLSYFLTGKFPVGVSKYVFWKGTTWYSRITCTHHLWTIPALLYATQGMHKLALPLSFVIMTTNVLLSRWLTPATIDYGPHVEQKYLNVNLSHELWKDIKFPFLQINYDDPPAYLYLYRLLWRWTSFNVIVFTFLYKASQIVWGDAPIC
jgi:hypothetical protein